LGRRLACGSPESVSYVVIINEYKIICVLEISKRRSNSEIANRNNIISEKLDLRIAIEVLKSCFVFEDYPNYSPV
jgi:hypothetical protein